MNQGFVSYTRGAGAAVGLVAVVRRARAATWYAAVAQRGARTAEELAEAARREWVVTVEQAPILFPLQWVTATESLVAPDSVDKLPLNCCPQRPWKRQR